MRAKRKRRALKDFNLKWWWYGLVEDLHLARQNELRALEEPVIRNKQGFIPPVITDLPVGWRCLSAEHLEKGNTDVFIRRSRSGLIPRSLLRLKHHVYCKDEQDHPKTAQCEHSDVPHSMPS